MSRKKKRKKNLGRHSLSYNRNALRLKSFCENLQNYLVWTSCLMNLMFFLVWTQFIWTKFEIDYIFRVSIKLKKYFKLENVKNQGQIPFKCHYNPWFLYFLPLKSSSKVIKWPLFLFTMMKFSLKRLHSSLNSHF